MARALDDSFDATGLRMRRHHRSSRSHPGTAARSAVVAAVKHACEHVGFFVITGHGVPAATIRSAFSNGRAFFTRPTEEKMRIKRPAPGVSRGYNSLADQSLALTLGQKAPPDLMESLGFGPLATDDDPYWTRGYGPIHAHPNLWPQDMPGFRAEINEAQLRDLLAYLRTL